MRVANDPLLLQALLVRREAGTSHFPPGYHFHVRVDCLGDCRRASEETGHVGPYGDVEPLQPVSLHPEVFEPRDEDKRHALWVSIQPMCAKPIFWRGGLLVAFAGAAVLVLVLLVIFA